MTRKNSHTSTIWKKEQSESTKVYFDYPITKCTFPTQNVRYTPVFYQLFMESYPILID